MNSTTIGLIKEGKVPVDKRVPVTPAQAALIKEKFAGTAVIAAPSPIRCYTDAEYVQQGIAMDADMTQADILLGVKEVPLDELIPDKTYLFFSHTIKKQPYNRNLLRRVLANRITLIDYECLLDSSGARIVAFGRYAGIVGAYNGILTYGQKHKLFNLRRAHECFDLADMQTEYAKVKLPAIKIALTGSGRVAKGAIEVLQGMGIEQVSPADFLHKSFDQAVFAQLKSQDYHERTDGQPYGRDDFYNNPTAYKGNFLPYAQAAHLLIAGAYWNPAAPVLFTRQEMTQPDFNIDVIADITCDIEGSIPSTKKPSTIEDPVYDFNPDTNLVAPAYSGSQHVSVMAVDNLPCELPRDASNDFGEELLNNVLPHLLGNDTEGIIKNATIAANGKLTPRYAYLEDYVKGQD